MSVKQEGRKYHFLSLQYDSTWTPVYQTIMEHSNHYANRLVNQVLSYMLVYIYIYIYNFKKPMIALEYPLHSLEEAVTGELGQNRIYMF